MATTENIRAATSNHKTRMTLVALFALVSLLTLTYCSRNALTGMSSDTDESLLFDAQVLINKSDWTDAIAKFSKMSSTFLSQPDVALAEAKAYAGRCGLNFLDFSTDLLNAGSENLFVTLVKAFPAGTVDKFNDCVTAETLIRTKIADSAASRTADENLTIALVALAKIGTVLSLRADFDGNGVIDWGNNDSCTVGTGSDGFLTSDEAKHIATGISIALDSFTALGSTVSGSTLTDLSTICSTTGVSFCTVYDISGIDATMEKAARTVAQEGAAGIGLGTCTASPNDVTNCACL